MVGEKNGDGATADGVIAVIGDSIIVALLLPIISLLFISSKVSSV